ncbi:MAG: ABC transporter substrate-binding protein [Candidatus Thorarchaeota archaeon]|nr:ABC transporter substrate-binding protein [Candidatus Thorarchaeota archaeon]
MEKNQLIAIVVIVLIVGVGAVYFLMNPLAPSNEVIIFGTTDSVEASLDPAQSYDYFGWEIITSLGAGLVEIIPGTSATANDIRGALASSWTVDSTNKIWDFTLRQGLTYYDGQPFNASCVKWSFERNIDMAMEDGPQLNMGYGDIIDSITVTSEYEVRFNLKIAFAPFLQLMACAASYIVHPDYKDDTTYVDFDAAEGARGSHPNDLGPYVLTNWTRVGGSDSLMRLEKNPRYWDVANIPKTDTIIIQFYSTDTALAAALTSGEIDVAYRHLSAAQVANFRTNTAVRVWDGVGASIQYMLFQQTIYPFNETRIRQGVAAALNRSNIASTVFEGTVDPLYSVVPAGMAYHEPSFEVYGDANYTFTADCLDDFGYNTTNKLVVDLWYESSGHYPSSPAQATVYKSDLEASGVITVNLHSADWPTYRIQRNTGTMPVFIYGWYPDFIDPDNYAFLPFASWLNLGYNETSPAGGVAQYDLWVEGRSAQTSALREAAYLELQELQAEEVSLIPLWQGRNTAVTKAAIQGVILDITVNWRHWLLYW